MGVGAWFCQNIQSSWKIGGGIIDYLSMSLIVKLFNSSSFGDSGCDLTLEDK